MCEAFILHDPWTAEEFQARTQVLSWSHTISRATTNQANNILAFALSCVSNLFPFDRTWRFRTDVVNNSINALNLRDDSRGNSSEDIMRQARPVSSHPVQAGN